MRVHRHEDEPAALVTAFSQPGSALLSTPLHPSLQLTAPYSLLCASPFGWQILFSPLSPQGKSFPSTLSYFCHYSIHHTLEQLWSFCESGWYGAALAVSMQLRFYPHWHNSVLLKFFKEQDELISLNQCLVGELSFSRIKVHYGTPLQLTISYSFQTRKQRIKFRVQIRFFMLSLFIYLFSQLTLNLAYIQHGIMGEFQSQGSDVFSTYWLVTLSSCLNPLSPRFLICRIEILISPKVAVVGLRY